MATAENREIFTRELLFSKDQVEARLEELALKIAQKYEGKGLLLVGVLNGAFIVMADLARALFQAGLTDIEIDFVQVSSYGSDTESSRHPRLVKDCSLDVYSRHVLLVEDIVDTGYSLAALQSIFAARGVASIETFSLLSKPSRREVEVSVDYIGFVVGDWVEGLGLDTNQQGRGNPNIVRVVPPSPVCFRKYPAFR